MRIQQKLGAIEALYIPCWNVRVRRFSDLNGDTGSIVSGRGVVDLKGNDGLTNINIDLTQTSQRKIYFVFI